MLPLVVGAGLEYEDDGDQAQTDVPFIVQYSFSETFQASAETAYTHIRSNDPALRSVSGLDDLETSIEYEFLRERRDRPSFTAFAGARWPTASDSEIGAEGTDFSVGLIATKEFDFFELDLNLIYTASGDPQTQDALDVPVAIQYPLDHFTSLALEIAPSFDMGGGGESVQQVEATLGAIWRANEFSTFEAGVVLRDDGTWQLVFGWEYSFAGD